MTDVIVLIGAGSIGQATRHHVAGQSAIIPIPGLQPPPPPPPPVAMKS